MASSGKRSIIDLDPAKEELSAKRQKRNPGEEMICVITQNLPIDPVTAEDGRVYEREAMKEYFKGKAANEIKSPYTMKPMGKRLTSATQHRNTIEILVENGSITGELAENWKKKVDEKTSMEDLIKKAKGGDIKATMKLGTSYYHGDNGFQEDKQVACIWLKKAHEAGNVRATGLLGEMHLRGLGNVTKKLSLGLTYLGMAAAQGSPVALEVLGMGFAEGKYGLEVDEDEARRMLDQAVNGEWRPGVGRLRACMKERAKKKLEELNGRLANDSSSLVS